MFQESESQYQVRDSCEDDPCAFDHDTVEYESEEEELLDADVDSVDDHETNYPFPSKLFVILYMLVKGTQQVVSLVQVFEYEFR